MHRARRWPARGRPPDAAALDALARSLAEVPDGARRPRRRARRVRRPGGARARGRAGCGSSSSSTCPWSTVRGWRGAEARRGERAVLAAAAAVVDTSALDPAAGCSTHYALAPAGSTSRRRASTRRRARARHRRGRRAALRGAPSLPPRGTTCCSPRWPRVADLPWRCVVRRQPGPATRPSSTGCAGRSSPAASTTGSTSPGPLAGADLDRAYAAADLLVLASRAETYGMVVTEALARGIPVVATDVGGLPEALGRDRRRHRPGLLVPPDDPAALAAALRRWLDDDAARGAGCAGPPRQRRLTLSRLVGPTPQRSSRARPGRGRADRRAPAAGTGVAPGRASRAAAVLAVAASGGSVPVRSSTGSAWSTPRPSRRLPRIALLTTVCCAWRWSLVARGLGVAVPLPHGGRGVLPLAVPQHDVPGGVRRRRAPRGPARPRGRRRRAAGCGPSPGSAPPVRSCRSC